MLFYDVRVMKYLDHILIYVCTITMLLHFTAGQVQAKIEISSSAPPTHLTPNEEFTLEVTLSGTQQDSQYFIRGVFFELETSNYFGFTQNNQGEWHNDSKVFDQFFAMSGESSALISFKLDQQSPFFHDNAQYLFKIGRYTPGGTLTWSDQTPAIITINSPVISPSPTIPTEQATPTPSPTALLTATPTQYTSLELLNKQVQLSEIMVCPNTNESEWVELYNSADHSVSLDNWTIRDSTDTHNKVLQETIPAKSFIVIALPSAILNNSGDSVRLFSDQNELIDQMSYSNCTNGLSYIQHENSWQITQIPTAGENNIWQPLLTPTLSSTTAPSLPTTAPTIPKTPIQSTENQSSYTNDTTPIPIASLSAQLSLDSFPKPSSESGVVLATSVTRTHTFSWLNKRFSFITAGVSYIFCAALLAQKWYNEASLI